VALRRALALALGLALTLAVAPRSAEGQDHYRVGITFGGTSFVGLAFEMFWGDASLDLSAGTWAFKDISLSAVGKYYAGNDTFEAYGGAGIWLVAAAPSEETERTGIAWILRMPVGVEGRIDQDHALGLEANLNRALSIRRPDPLDDMPPNRRIVPLPGFYYRFAVNQDAN
jgi:hypothetical protein